jgi:tRNA(fMet)-specific endonuclease VapC
VQVLDTDHASEWTRGSEAGNRLRTRASTVKFEGALAIVTVEEQMRGWLAEIRHHDDPHRQISAYAKFQRQIESFNEWIILPWDTDAANLFQQFRRAGVRIGTMDLKIACVVLAHDATLLTRNTVDFAQVPGLRFENWLD